MYSFSVLRDGVHFQFGTLSPPRTGNMLPLLRISAMISVYFLNFELLPPTKEEASSSPDGVEAKVVTEVAIGGVVSK